MIGRIVLDIAPGEGNPRNSEGSFLTLADGTIMLAYSRFNGNHWGDDTSADIVAIYSDDHGQTFKNQRILFKRSERNAKNIMSVSLLRLDKERIAAFYMVRMGFHDLRAVMHISTDEGKTFGQAVYCINYPGYYVVNNDRIVKLSNGRIFIPAAFHRCIGPDPIAWQSFNGKGVVRFFYTDDEKIFYEAPDFGSINVSGGTGLQEPGVVEIDDGHLFGYARTDLGCQYTSHSYDYGMTWEPFKPSEFTSPVSPMSIKKAPGTDAYVALYNPVPTPKDIPKYGWGRTPMIARVSNDGCKTFGEPIVIEDNPESGYCYIAIHFTDKDILLAYCAGGPDDGGCLNRLRIRSIPIKDIIK